MTTTDIYAYLQNPLWLAPMAGVTDRAFRTLCLRHGAGLTYCEMVSAKGLEYDNEKSWDIVEPADEEPRLAVQLFGRDPMCMATQAARVEERLNGRLALIDVNMGCPVRKIVSKGEGAALMKTPELAAEIIARIVEKVSVRVTAKIRSGWTSERINAPEFAQALEQAGASLVSVHGRSARQFYRGSADWGVIAQVKAAVSIPVAGSGDVFSRADAQRMIESTDVDVVMVARGARGNPWIFEQRKPSALEQLEAAHEHLQLYLHFSGDKHLSPLRTQLAWYLKGLPDATSFRRKLSKAVTRQDYEQLFNEAFAICANVP